MGQQIGRLPDTWRELIEEKDRVLHWSSEVLARVDDNITNEDTFLMDYDDKRIDQKVYLWIGNEKHKWDVALSRFHNAPEESRNLLKNRITKEQKLRKHFGGFQLSNEIRKKMRRDYRKAYSDMREFAKKMDALGTEERKIHKEIQSLETRCQNDRKKFAMKFGPLRKNVFNNLRVSEKMLFVEKRLQSEFIKKVYDVDHKHMEAYARNIDKFIKDFETCAGTSR